MSSFMSQERLPKYSMDSHRSSSSATHLLPGQSKKSAVKSALSTAKRALKEHHEAVNSAFDAYYGTTYYGKHA